MENRWPERQAFVAGVGCRVGCTCLLVGDFASCGGGVCVRVSFPGGQVGARDQNQGVRGAKEWG